MSPNPVVLLSTAVNVKRWFGPKPPPSQKPKGRLEHRDEPVPGIYEYRPGRGLLLVAIDEEDGQKLDQPVPVIYCKLLHRNMLESDYKSRQKHGFIINEYGKKQVGTFFRIDDGFTWVYWRDQYGRLDNSSRRRKFCVDAQTGQFRPLTCNDVKITGQGTSIARPSIRDSVVGDIHPVPAKSSHPSSTATTRSNTKPSTRRNSSTTPASRQAETASSASTPPCSSSPPCPKLDEAELDKRLRRLASY